MHQCPQNTSQPVEVECILTPESLYMGSAAGWDEQMETSCPRGGWCVCIDGQCKDR